MKLFVRIYEKTVVMQWNIILLQNLTWFSHFVVTNSSQNWTDHPFMYFTKFGSCSVVGFNDTTDVSILKLSNLYTYKKMNLFLDFEEKEIVNSN
jgi:hypothetical protein